MPYTEKSTEELRAMLREDGEKPAGEGMTYEELRPILETLASRTGNGEEQAARAWADFRAYYDPARPEIIG